MPTLLVVADDDSAQRSAEPGRADVLIACGDIADDVILQVAGRIECSSILAVKGNHDASGEFPPPIIDLHLNVCSILGVRFGGFRGSWRYKPRGNYLYEQDEVNHLMASFPPVDVFVAHNSPRHIHDRNDDVHLGFDAFNRYIERTQPRLFIHGHQHICRETIANKTRVVAVYGHKRLEC
jgi:Icc-related predicted phosphoesterase